MAWGGWGRAWGAFTRRRVFLAFQIAPRFSHSFYDQLFFGGFLFSHKLISFVLIRQKVLSNTCLKRALVNSMLVCYMRLFVSQCAGGFFSRAWRAIWIAADENNNRALQPKRQLASFSTLIRLEPPQPFRSFSHQTIKLRLARPIIIHPAFYRVHHPSNIDHGRGQESVDEASVPHREARAGQHGAGAKSNSAWERDAWEGSYYTKITTAGEKQKQTTTTGATVCSPLQCFFLKRALFLEKIFFLRFYFFNLRFFVSYSHPSPQAFVWMLGDRFS